MVVWMERQTSSKVTQEQYGRMKDKEDGLTVRAMLWVLLLLFRLIEA